MHVLCKRATLKCIFTRIGNVCCYCRQKAKKKKKKKEENNINRFKSIFGNGKLTGLVMGNGFTVTTFLHFLFLLLQFGFS